MNSNNPWADTTSQGTPYNNDPNQRQPQQGPNQTHVADSQQGQHHQSGYDQPQQGGYNAPQGPPPSHGIRRSDTEQVQQVLAQEGDRAAQFEHMQEFEAAAPQSEDDKNQAELQKLFPNIDSSLIAAIYNERKPDMGEVKELLQELDTS